MIRKILSTLVTAVVLVSCGGGGGDSDLPSAPEGDGTGVPDPSKSPGSDLPSNIRIIPAGFLCSTETVPDIFEIDFMRVSSGRNRVKSFKICNVGETSVKVNSTSFLSNPSGPVSRALTPPEPKSFNWNVDDVLNQAFFPYINPPTSPNFNDLEPTAYVGAQPPTPTTFSVTATTAAGTTQAANNIVIAAGSYARFDVTFSPRIASEAPSGEIYLPVPIGTTLQLQTNLGTFGIDTFGATGGYEPTLKIVTSGLDETPPSCAATGSLDLTSDSSAIYFGEADIYADWIPEDINAVTLRLCNTGTGTRPLKVWADPINEGYFRLSPFSNIKSWPITIAPGTSQLVTLEYTPTSTEAHDAWDLGQLILNHDGANGPTHLVTLLGSQKPGAIINLEQDGSMVKSTSDGKGYDANKRKKFGCMKVGVKEIKDFTLHNNSRKYNLLSQVSISGPVTVTTTTGTGTAATTITAALKDLDSGSATSGTLTTPKNDRRAFSIEFTLPSTLRDSSTLKGYLKIVNNYPGSPSGERPPNYDIYFEAALSRTGTCSGSSGEPPDGTAYLVIDRITMNLIPGLDDPARNPPPFKFHLPVDFDRNLKRARIHELTYNPKTVDKPEQQIQIYAHQITNGANCPPLPTNPYRREFEQGSWDDPSTSCGFETEDKSIFLKGGTDGGVACIANNGAQDYILEDANEVAALNAAPGAPQVKLGDTLQVFYHEFVKYAPGASCGTPQMYGRFSTFVLRPGEKATDVFKRMLAEVGPNGSEADYATHTIPFSFGSYIKFNDTMSIQGCSHAAGATVIDPDALRSCVTAFVADKTIVRANGMVNECSYFQFEIERGCAPGDENSNDEDVRTRCRNVNWNDPKTWVGYGEYEPDPSDDELYNLTLRNVRISAFSLSHSYVQLFGHAGRLLFDDIYVTLTTKAVGKPESGNPYNTRWDSLIAERTKKDYTQNEVLRPITPEAEHYWINSGVNGQFTVFDKDLCANPDTTGDECFDVKRCEGNDASHCRGNYEFVDGRLVHAGEPIHLGQNNRTIIVGLGAFNGPGQLAPQFARSAGSKGKPLYFTFHGCLKETTVVDGVANPLPSTTGCYEAKLDDDYWEAGDDNVVNAYVTQKILKSSDLNASDENPTKAWINYEIFEEDRNRLTNYYKKPAQFKFNPDTFKSHVSRCGFGN